MSEAAGRAGPRDACGPGWRGPPQLVVNSKTETRSLSAAALELQTRPRGPALGSPLEAPAVFVKMRIPAASPKTRRGPWTQESAPFVAV